MKKALVLGLFAFALLISFAMAEEDLDSSAYQVPTETELAAAVAASCPNGIQDTCGGGSGSLCGQEIEAIPGQKLYLAIKDEDPDLDYEWKIEKDGQTIFYSCDPTLNWVVPVVSETTTYKVCLYVYNPDAKECNDRCCFTVVVDPIYCCPDVDIEACETDLPKLTTYCYGYCCPVNGMYFKWQLEDPAGHVFNLPLASGEAWSHRCVVVSWPLTIALAKLSPVHKDHVYGTWKVLLKIGNTRECTGYTCDLSTTTVYEQPDKPQIKMCTSLPCPT